MPSRRPPHRLPGEAVTLDLEHVRYHCYGSHKHINPAGLIPKGPDVLAALANMAGQQPGHRVCDGETSSSIRLS